MKKIIAFLLAAIFIALISACSKGHESQAPGMQLLPEPSGAAGLIDNHSDQFHQPDQRGPFEVGVMTIQLVDESRYESWGEQYRAMPVEIWYPSNGKGGEPNTILQMVGDMPPWGMPLMQLLYGDKFETLRTTETTAMRGAEWADGQERFPVLLFSHGNSAIRFQNYTLCEHLASHGFVVAAPDHYGNAIFVNIPGEAVILFDPLSMVSTIWDRQLDIEFLYNFLKSAAGNAEYPWAGRLNLDRFGITGHSYGGTASILAGELFDFIGAIAPLNPAWLDLPLDLRKPMLMLQSDKDQIVGIVNYAARDYFDKSTSSEKIHLELLNAGHYNATDACTLLPPWFAPHFSGCDGSRIDPAKANFMTSAYVTAFFKSALLKDHRYDWYLSENFFHHDLMIETTW